MRSVTSVVFSLAVVLCSLTASAGTITLGFDDLTNLQAPIPSGYGGLNWSNAWVVNGDTTVPSGYLNGMVSAPNVAYNNKGKTADVTSGTPGTLFTFVSADLTAAWNNGMTITIDGYKGGVDLYHTAVLVNATAPKLVTLNWSGIDDLRLAPSGGVSAGYPGTGTAFAMDNFTYKTGPAVPEPESIVLGSVACIFIALYLSTRKF